ncbi:hypothetical protein C8J56DRAFT_896585 [Mycena floridula]|nr:hypothetical protein C8J56DRAFT_896585 [Mycena floridula]
MAESVDYLLENLVALLEASGNTSLIAPGTKKSKKHIPPSLTASIIPLIGTEGWGLGLGEALRERYGFSSKTADHPCGAYGDRAWVVAEISEGMRRETNQHPLIHPSQPTSWQRLCIVRGMRWRERIGYFEELRRILEIPASPGPPFGPKATKPKPNGSPKKLSASDGV